MTKSILPNFKKWTIDEKRLVLVFLLTLIYPVFVSSFFALYVFVLMPVMVPVHFSFVEAHHAGWYHFYWLFVSILWVILCALILPLLKKRNVLPMMTLTHIESNPLMQPPVKEEVKDEEGSLNNLSQKSESSSNHTKKASYDSEPEKESLRKSKESLNKSSASLDRKKLTQSGEFLNDFMSTIDSENVKENETVCEIHAEESKEVGNSNIKDKKGKIKDDQDHQSEKEDNKNEEGDERKSNMKDMNTLCGNDKGNYSDNSSESSCSNEEKPFISAQETKPLQTSSPLKVNEAIFEQHDGTGESEMTEEVNKLDNDLQKVSRGKGISKIDTSRASGYYECSMPTPLSVDSKGSQNNTVFLFINSETTATEDSILVSHGGKVEDSVDEKTDP